MTDSVGKRKGKRKGKSASRAAREKKLLPNDNEVDMISELPDDILISILSRLPLQDATRTSILSTRWRHLWTYITHLHFQPLKLPNRFIPFTPPKEKKKFHPLKGSSIESNSSRFLNKPMKTPQKEFSKDVDWINHVLDCYNGGHALKEFRLSMPTATHVDVEKWLDFGLSRKVETLYIHFDQSPSGSHFRGKFLLKKYGGSCRCFKCRKIGNNIMENIGDSWLLKCLKDHHIENLILKNNGCQCFMSLKTLYLHNVDLHAIELELLLSNCVVLETLSITYSLLLGNGITIGGPSLKLKHLKIRYCSTAVHIRDLINLISFNFAYSISSLEKVSTPLVVENVPMLTEIDCYHNSHVELLSTVLSCCLYQLRKLTLKIEPFKIKNYGWHYSLPKLMNLKYLVLILDMRKESCILTLAPLIEASPFLEKFDVVFWWPTPKFKDREPFDKKLWEHPHNNLKQVRFLNYLGSPYEFEFGLYIFKNAVNLEEFVIQPRPKYKAWALGKQLQATIPQSVKLVIL